MINHPNASEYTYTLLVDGKLISQSKVYDYIMNRGLGIALYLKLDFVNTKSPQIVDKWTNGTQSVKIIKTILKDE